MYQTNRVLLRLGILGFSLMLLAGCGEKRVHVSTASGAPGEDLALNEMGDDLANRATSGLNTDNLDESALLSQGSESEAANTNSAASSGGNEPLNMAHAPAVLSPQDLVIQDEGSDSSSSPVDQALADTAGSDNEQASSPVSESQDLESQDFSAQSSSSPEDEATQPLSHTDSTDGIAHDELQNVATTNTEPLDTSVSQDSLAGIEDILSGENLEPIPDTFQIAKVDPSESLEDRMNQINEEELEAAKAGLEDVFFQFDSWALTQEGKESLQRTYAWFEQEPDSNLIIEGHADQRGTQAYNMVLAKKRAVAVQDYLSRLGADESRMSVISYGKDKPFCQDVTEVCHQLNRRGHLLVAN